MPPPDHYGLMSSLAADDLLRVLRATSGAMQGEYLSWERLRYKTPPDGLTHEEWWTGLKMARNTVRRSVPRLRDVSGSSFHYTLPDSLLRSIDEITRSASGSISINDEVTNPATRDRYVVSSLIEEAITSSQLEGASTSRRVARELLRSGRPPRDHSERMIVNNYSAMQRVVELRDTPLTPELVCELHAIVTDGTLEDPAFAGTVQTVQDDRVAVWDEQGRLLHQPPPVNELTERLRSLCAFANGDFTPKNSYIPPVLRAISVHFMMGYDHYFEDGNGRTARALFYWSMLNQGFWLTEFLTISTILKKAPAQYVRSYLLTEQDEGDLTYFFLYHCEVALRAIKALHEHLAIKVEELRNVQDRVHAAGTYNHRQLAVIEHVMKDPGASFTVRAHARSHAVTEQTARVDLQKLEERGILSHVTRGRQWVFHPAPGAKDVL